MLTLGDWTLTLEETRKHEKCKRVGKEIWKTVLKVRKIFRRYKKAVI